jgi:chloramphenicol O-acetyltransferase type A
MIPHAQPIDLNTYERLSLYQFFKAKSYPVFATTTPMDITLFKAYTQAHQLPFFVSLSFIVHHIVNELEAFKHRIMDDTLYRFDFLHNSFTIAENNQGAYQFGDVCYNLHYPSYKTQAMQCIADIQQKKYITNPSINKQQCVFITSIPWFSFTSFHHPYDPVYGSVPIITLGKYYANNQQLWMPVALQVHHALMDGYHVGLFYDKLQKALLQPHSFFQS